MDCETASGFMQKVSELAALGNLDPLVFISNLHSLLGSVISTVRISTWRSIGSSFSVKSMGC